MLRNLKKDPLALLEGTLRLAFRKALFSQSIERPRLEKRTDESSSRYIFSGKIVVRESYSPPIPHLFAFVVVVIVDVGVC